MRGFIDISEGEYGYIMNVNSILSVRQEGKDAAVIIKTNDGMSFRTHKSFVEIMMMIQTATREHKRL